MLERDDWLFFFGGAWTVLGIVLAQWVASNFDVFIIAATVFVLLIALSTFVGRIMTRFLLTRIGYGADPDEPPRHVR